MAQLSKTTIRLSDVQKALGYFPNTVSGVCTYSGINKWSLHKPFQSNTVEFPTYEYLTNALRIASCGLAWDGGSTEDSFTALLPQGGSTSQPDQASPYRLGDFRGYDHWQEHMIGVADIKPSVNLGNFSSFTRVSPLSGGENGIGLLDMRGLFIIKGLRYLYFQMRLPKSGGTSYDKPANGYYVNTDGRRIGTQQVYYGMQVSSGRITAIFRARTPTTVLPTITLVINVSKVSGETNKYQITFNLTASTTPSERVTVTISALQLRKTQTGSSMTGTFTNMNGSVFNGRTLSIGGSGVSLTAAPAYLVTSLATPFWVTATATCDNGNYQFINKGGSTAESSGGVTPVNPGG